MKCKIVVVAMLAIALTVCLGMFMDLEMKTDPPGKTVAVTEIIEIANETALASEPASVVSTDRHRCRYVHPSAKVFIENASVNASGTGMVFKYQT